MMRCSASVASPSYDFGLVKLPAFSVGTGDDGLPLQFKTPKDRTKALQKRRGTLFFGEERGIIITLNKAHHDTIRISSESDICKTDPNGYLA